MKPPLLVRDLDLGHEFNPLTFPITDALVDAFCTATGETNPLFVDADAAKSQGFIGRVAPPGLAGIFGRQAYLRDYAMPPGGVLAGQSIDFHGPAFVGDTLEVRATVVARDEQKGRPRVTIQSVARRHGGEEVATVRVVALWPLDPIPEPDSAESRGA